MQVQDLDVFKLLHRLAIEIYKLTKEFPNDEKFGLISQMRRAAYSIPMNLCEGSMRLGTKEYKQFVGIARGSCGEIQYQLLLSKDLSYVSEQEYKELFQKYERVGKMLTNLVKALEKRKHEHESPTRVTKND